MGDKVKCNCIKHCECAVKSAFGAAPGGAAALANLVQLNQATNCSSIEASEPKPTEGEPSRCWPHHDQQRNQWSKARQHHLSSSIRQQTSRESIARKPVRRRVRARI